MKIKAVPSAIPKINAFISYSHEDRKYAGQVKAVLATFGIDAFLAHEDIHVSHDWRDRILQELKRCELFVALLSKNFLNSKWAPQEVGFIVSRAEVRVMPISLDETVACGFIGNLQSKRIHEEEVTCDFLLPALVHHFPRTIFPNLIQSIKDAHTFRSGEDRLGRLVPYFSALTAPEINLLAEHCVKNSQIWDAKLCRDEYLPEFLRLHGPNISAKISRALRYQLKNHDWYRPEDE